jgi:hypothetical protein
VDVVPLVRDVKARYPSGWCVYSAAFDSPEIEVLAGGINHKTPAAASVWRQGHLLHFGFDLSPEEMTDRGQAMLLNAIVYIARFTEDRPITHAPDRAVLRPSVDRTMAKPAPPDSFYLEWYFSPAVRTAGKADDWPAFQTWYKQNRDYLHADRARNGSLVLDDDAKAFGVPPGSKDFLPAAIAALKERGERSALAGKLLRRYSPDGPKDGQPDAWQRWWDEIGRYIFFSEAGWYRWYVDPLAKKRGVPTAELRGVARATRPAEQGR